MIVPSSFKPAWWLKNKHLQTIWPSLFRSTFLHPKPERFRLELADGDFIDVDWYENRSHTSTSTETVLLLHGLEGSGESTYIVGLVNQFLDQGKSVAVKHFRSCSGEINRLKRCYHSGVTDDLQEVIQLLSTDKNIIVDYLVGFSLGGNVLLKWLGENHSGHHIKAAVAVSVPLMLEECANAIEKGFSKIYVKNLLKTLNQKMIEKKKIHPDLTDMSDDEIRKMNTFWVFDEAITAPVHGFESAQDYYNKVSSRQFLSKIKIPTLIIHAKDDPFMNEKIIPDDSELSHLVKMEISDRGGHVGFIEGNMPFYARYYLDKRIPNFLDNYQSEVK